MANTELMDTEDELKFYQDVHTILDEAKSKSYEAANNIMTYAYWNVGKRIIEQEQKGNRKAKYGSYLIKRLSQELSDKYGTGFSVANIRNCRQLYLTFPKESYGYSLIGKINWWKDDYAFCDDGPYETEHVKVSKGDIVIDCGANIGISTANAVARKCKKVYAIEPVMNNSLANCKELFGDRMEICQVAVSDYEGSATIHINPDSCNDNSIYHVQNTLREELEIEVTTVDSLCETMSLQDIGYMKFYIDDLEGRMIAGAQETIRTYRPKIAIFPCRPDNTDALKSKLEELIRGIDSSYVFEYAYNKMFAYPV